MSAPQSRLLSLNSGEIAVDVDPLGAQLSALRDRAGRDLLWDGDPAVWRGRAPLLFPIVGELAGGAYRLGGKTYRLPRHGFAREKVFEVLQGAADRASFRLTADENTLAVYPFRFELQVDFRLQEATLAVTTHIRNLEEVAMPASFGYHPAFRWPLPYGRPRAEHFIEFATDEPAPARRLDAQGLLTPARHPTPIARRRLVLEDALFRDDALIFDAVMSRSVTYGAALGPRLRVSFADARYLGVWSKPGAGFICIEPWRGLADPEGFDGDFTAKPGVFVVAPGQTLTVGMSVSLEPAVPAP